MRGYKQKIEIGQKFGRWTILSDLGTTPERGSLVLVKCECGNQREHFYQVLKKGLSTSCGCWRREQAKMSQAAKFTKHSLSKHPIFGLWMGMKARCFNKKSRNYPDYGGRGITVCREWLNDFKAFYDWAIANGWQKGLINDRKDNDGDYSPANCRFVTDAVSMRNTRNNNYIEFGGERLVITDWAARLDMSTTSLAKRVENWGIEKALTTPKQKKRSHASC
jgi:hypothetical protein